MDISKKFSQAAQIEFFLRLGLLPVLIIRFFCKPLTLIMLLLERGLQSSNQKIANKQEKESEVADHIRVVGREGTKLRS